MEINQKEKFQAFKEKVKKIKVINKQQLIDEDEEYYELL